MKMPMKTKKGFTLIEVLAALCLLGILAGLTVPTLIIEANKRTYVAGLLRAESMLKRTTTDIMANNAGTMAGNNFTGSSLRDLYCSNTGHSNNRLNCITTCTSSITENCMNQPSTLTGITPADDFDKPGAVLSNGMALIFSISADGVSPNCANTWSFPGQSIGCGEIIVDINGKRPPNTMGRDVFYFQLANKGIFPDGIQGTVGANWGTYCSASSNGNYNGEGCGGKITSEGNKMNY